MERLVFDEMANSSAGRTVPVEQPFYPVWLTRSFFWSLGFRLWV